MNASSTKRLRFGDVVRIVTPQGAAVAQYIHKHPDFGAVVRVIGPDTPERQQESPDVVARRPTQFVTMFPLGPACHRGIAQIIGQAPVPIEHRDFPMFRQALRLDPRDRGPCNWLLWDGETEQIVPSLTPEQYALPLRAIMNDTLLVERTLSGWTSTQER